MPNWCENKLTITGPNKSIKRFFKRAFDERNPEVDKLPMEGNFIRYMIPNPFLNADGEVIDREKNGDAWYHWEHNNYGCKWGACDTMFDLRTGTGGCLTILFNSAWGPPVQAIATLAKRFPSLYFRNEYSETGMMFCGIQIAHGKESHDESRDMTDDDLIANYSADDDAVLESLKKKLHPARFIKMSPLMGALVAFLLGETWTKPKIYTLSITSDGFLVSQDNFIGSVADFERNLGELFESARLHEQEIDMMWMLFNKKITDWRKPIPEGDLQ